MTGDVLSAEDREALMYHIGAWRWESKGLLQAEVDFMDAAEAIEWWSQTQGVTLAEAAVHLASGAISLSVPGRIDETTSAPEQPTTMHDTPHDER